MTIHNESKALCNTVHASSKIPVHEAKRAVVYGETQDAHVVSVEYAMAETHTLPQGYQLGCLYGYLQ